MHLIFSYLLFFVVFMGALKVIVKNQFNKILTLILWKIEKTVKILTNFFYFFIKIINNYSKDIS